MLTVRTGSRLHFGLTAFGHDPTQPDRRLYGGVGVMVDKPGLVLRIESSETFEVDPGGVVDIEPRIRSVAANWLGLRQRREELPIGVDSLEDLPIKISCFGFPPAHSGFGSGTQLALATVTALQSYFESTPLNFNDSITVAGRGRRSTVGSHGFFRGGFIVDRGKLSHEPISPLECHERVPEAWRFVIACPRRAQGLFGDREVKAFRNIPAVPATTTKKLQEEIHGQMLPAIRDADFDRFANSLWRYGSLAGSCFESVQGGCFNGPEVTRLVTTLRGDGYLGVGQSSWGPAVFTVVPSKQHAETLVERLANSELNDSLDVWITPPRNTSYTLETHKRQTTPNASGRK